MDIDDGFGPSYTQEAEEEDEEDDEYEDDEDYEDVPVIKSTIVNEKDLQGVFLIWLSRHSEILRRISRRQSVVSTRLVN